MRIDLKKGKKNSSDELSGMYSLSYLVVKKSLDRLKVDELKQPQTEKQIESLNLDLFTTSFKYSLDKLTLEWSKKMKIKIYTMLLDTDSVERRLRGISKLKESF